MAEEEKLAKLKTLLPEAIAQIVKKLTVVKVHMSNLKSLEDIDNDTKHVCTLLVEIKELVKLFPSFVVTSKTEVDIEGCDEETVKFLRFRANVVDLVVNILERLNSVEKFVLNTNSLQQAMTVAITIRDITKHLKVVSTKGKRVINIPRAKLQASGALHAGSDQSVGEIVAYYSELNTPRITNNNNNHNNNNNNSNDSANGVNNNNNNNNQIAEETKKNIVSEELQPTLSSNQVSQMEEAIHKRMTINMKKGDLYNKMLDNVDTDILHQKVPAKELEAPAPVVNLAPESRVWKQLDMKKQYKGVFGNSWKDHHWQLDGKSLCCYQSSSQTDIAMKTYALADMNNIVWKSKNDEEPALIVIQLKGDRKLCLQHTSYKKMCNLLLAINALQCAYCNLNSTIFSPSTLSDMLRALWKAKHRGGEIKSSYDEEWTYSKDGTLKSSIGLDEPLAFKWDGSNLLGVDETSKAIGSGKWDGLSLVWFNTNNGVIGAPSLRYDWDEEHREYHDPNSETQVWKWTRHFLASKFAAGEWIVEGEVPEPVVMFLQIMRTTRLRKFL